MELFIVARFHARAGQERATGAPGFAAGRFEVVQHRRFVGVLSDQETYFRQFAGLAAIVGHPEWIEDPDFSTNPARVAARDRIVPMVAEIIATKPAAEWLEQLEVAGIPAGPINSISQALADPQAVHRGARLDLGGGALGEVPMVGNPIRLDGERADAPLPPPALGEHGDLLRQWVDDAELAKLKAAGIVG